MTSLRVAAVLVLAAMAASVAVAVGNQPEAVRMVQGASSGEHLWIVVPSDRDPQRWHLLHHAWEMDGPYYSPQPLGLSREPEAMAAYGERLWLIFPPRGEGPPQRGVFTVAVERDAALEIYRPTPRDRLQILEALPAAGRLTSFVATDRGPIALLVPRSGDDPRARGVIEQPDSPPDPGADDAGDADFGTESAEPVAPDLAEAAARRPLLLQMRSKRWRELALPDDIVLTSAVRLAVAGYDRSALVVLSVDPSDSARTLLHRMSFDQDAADEQVIWDRSSLELDLNRVLAVETVRGRLVAVVQDESRQQPHLRYIRPTKLLELGEMPDPRGRWNVFGMADVMRMIEYSTRDGAMMRRINPVTGEATKPELMRVQPLPAGRMWYTSLLLAAAVVAVLLVLLVRPGRQDKVELAKGVGVMPPIPRLLALVMDLFPGGVVSVLVLRCSPIDVLRLPIFTDSLELALPFLVMVGVAFVHMTLTEMIKGTTLGKALLGARVISNSGQRPDAKQVLIRNAVKVLILLVPVLAIFALLNPNLRGFNDLVARTVVVGDVHDGEGDATDSTDRESS